MSLNWKPLRLLALPALLVVCAGCGGFSASKSISPATFLLPGLMKADPPPPPADSDLPSERPVTTVAQF